MTGEEAPFRPRPRRRALLGDPRGGGGSSGRTMGPLALLALAGTLFCFWQVFRAFGAMPGQVHAPLDDARSPLAWFLLGTACAATLPYALERRVERKAALKPGALRASAREAWATLAARARRRTPPP